MAASNEWTGKVADDMQGIFASAGLAGDRIDDARPSRDVSRLAIRDGRSPTPRRARWLTMAAPVAALATAGFLFTQIDTASPVNAASARRVVAPRVDHVAAFTAVAPSVPSQPTDAVLRVDDGVATATPLPVDRERPLATPTIVKVAATTPRERPEPATSRAAPDAAPVSRGGGCRAGSTDDACIYRDVRAADRRLVVAYQRAVQAGVPRRDLVEVRRDWTRALAISLDDPDETIRRYDDLTDQLRYMATAG